MKKQIWRVLALTLGLALILIGTVNAAGFNWKRYEGTTIRYVGETGPTTKHIREILPEFEKLTGIKVLYEDYVAKQMRQKIAVELAGKSNSLDMYNTLPMVVGRQYFKAGFIETLDKYVNDPTMTSPDYDFKDFSQATQDICRRYFGGKLGCIPISPQTQILYYRKDLFKAAGLKPPETLEEMEAAAKKLCQDVNGDGKIDIYGIALRGKGYEAVTQLSYYLYTMGGKWRKDDGSCNMTSAKNLAALDFYGRMLRKYGPPGSVNMNEVEMQSLFAQGKAAMYSDIATRRAVFEDPKRSKVAGKVGYLKIPKAPDGNRQMMLPLNAMYISSFSKKKGAAWYLIQYLTSKETLLRFHLDGLASPRVSSWQSEKYKAKETHPDWAEATSYGIKTGIPLNVPDVQAVGKAREIIGQAIQASILGRDVKEAAEKCCKTWNKLLKKTGDL